jgi:BirA family biotin operon repressor/biotin-[acetyl-CoA-carboxylase] ligase
VLLTGAGKVAGILVEGRPQDGWAVVGIGLNVALRPEDFPEELRDRAASLSLAPEAIEPLLDDLLAALERWLAAATEQILDAWRERDALLGREIAWEGGRGRAAGIDGAGRLVVELPGHGPGRTSRTTLQAGEVHLVGVRG